MKVHVDEERCRGHGMCTTLCPEVFASTTTATPRCRCPRCPPGRRMRPVRRSSAARSRPIERRRLNAKGICHPDGGHQRSRRDEGLRESAASPAMGQGGCKILSVETKPQVLEGDWHGDQTVVLEFDSVDAARAWYESEAYQKAAKLRQAAADCNAVILSGFGLTRPLRIELGERVDLLEVVLERVVDEPGGQRRWCPPRPWPAASAPSPRARPPDRAAGRPAARPRNPGGSSRACSHSAAVATRNVERTPAVGEGERAPQRPLVRPPIQIGICACSAQGSTVSPPNE